MVHVNIFNQKSLKIERKGFRTIEMANEFYNKRMAKVQLVCEPTERCFSYKNQNGNLIQVQKMY